MGTFGTPGTFSSGMLRLLQALFSMLSFLLVMIAPRLLHLLVSWFLIIAALSVIGWNTIVLFYDMVIICKGGGPGTKVLTCIAIGDLIMWHLLLGAASITVAPVSYYAVNTSRCSYMPKSCALIFGAVGSAYISSCLIAISFLVVLRRLLR